MTFNKRFLRTVSLFVPLLLLSASAGFLRADETTYRTEITREVKRDRRHGPTVQEMFKRAAFKTARLAVAAAQVYAGLFLLSKKSEGSLLSTPINKVNTASGLLVLFSGLWTGLGALPSR